ncbi:MAG: tetraacyldisaccharide 4'-kinase [Acetobacter fabarum]|jgi:tetraacyldisaccharide 4'-kinase|nr:tetraacyldisaccharide 4'-kinase [Acetobacter fabarum]MCH4026715.1 tetraacyldisaccharide 4'-kinase [Acetobacter fabarum]MCH4056038.1 tetraacyldisaccharide 4'-kinase [Acetobacter fabarum]MCH4085424.1 tetraacyldisaccharide 4'-kinase [Acetobacter fabarum]MCH4127032.1 tetraacyldisaccharide 4'-kinase [Acetobacter fabarum]MCH4137333.1 tetraacyldisaccharide 4'-kinase [Acetobacter fabarum]
MVRLTPPAFWGNPQARFWPTLLAPLAWGVAGIARSRMRRPGRQAPVPVLCCGNVSVGGVGKTTVVIDLVQRLSARGRNPHVLTRGYGGREANGIRVNPARHTARQVGDEPLLLAEYCPVWVGGDRSVTARHAVQAGADCLIMDDGFQNPSLQKTFSLLVVDGAVGFGNGRVLPAGPLRERVGDAMARADALLVIGADQTGAVEHTAVLPVLWADLEQCAIPPSVVHRPCVAFAGIGRPEKFFKGLQGVGLSLARALPYPDHYAYKRRDIERLLALANRLDAQLVTTPKDAMRLPPDFRKNVAEVGVRLVWQDPTVPERLLDMFLAAPA